MSAKQATVVGRIGVATAKHNRMLAPYRKHNCRPCGIDCSTHVSLKILEIQRSSPGPSPELC